MALVDETAHQSDFRKGRIWRAQQFLRALDPFAHQPTMGRLSRDLPERPREMARSPINRRDDPCTCWTSGASSFGYWMVQDVLTTR
jgi:hypothetical protein